MLHEKPLPIATGEGQPRRRPRIVAFDLIRLLIIAFVVSVHVLSNVGATLSPALGGFITVFHTSRELFFVLTALVLTYNYGEGRPVRWLPFWRLRYLMVAPAYVVWTLIYFLADNPRLSPLSATFTPLWHDLLTGGARYHLYFLLVTMQLYLAFPLVRWLLKRTEGHHGALLAAAVVYQVALTVVVQHQVSAPFPVGGWLHSPSEWLPSYVLYVLAGALAGWHFERLADFTRRHTSTAYLLAVAAACAGVGSYCTELLAAGQRPVVASAVWQPVVIVEAFGFAWGLLAFGLRWSDQGAKGRRLAAAGADCSFGIYLAHPLVLQGVVIVARHAGVQQSVTRAPALVVLVVLLGVCVPLVYGISWILAYGLRRTPLSLMLTGRPMRSTPRMPRLRWAAVGVTVLCVGIMVAGLQVARGDASASARASSTQSGARASSAPSASPQSGVAQVNSPAGSAGSAIRISTSVQATGSATEPATLVSSDYSMTFDGQIRTWTQLTPLGGLPASAPVIVVLSGINATPAKEIVRDHLATYVQAGQAELVYPEGYLKSWNAGGCCGKAAKANIDDTGFLEALAAAVDPGSRQPLDLVGYSNGGRLAYRMACSDPGLFGEIAVVKAMPEPGCVVSSPVSILQIDSINDTAVPFNPGDKGKESPPATVQVARLTSAGHCPSPPSVQLRGTMQLSTWTGCADSTRIGFAVYKSGGHSFPQALAATPAAATVVWAFFTGSALPPAPH
jgi:poly(3-hydroxybutyrate) depolymerase/peptidoglycan/LPS O-acetylase OafA/YrhL